MKTLIFGLMVAGFALSSLAVDKAELDNRIRSLTAKFEAMQAKPDKAVPADILEKARGVILLDRTRAGFIFAYQGGGGVALVKYPKTDKWSSVAFLSATEASLGFQIGGEQSFFVILLMNTNSTRMLIDPNFEFGGEASGTAGNESAGAQGTVSSKEVSILVYSDRKGLYGGAAIKGGALSPDTEANQVYYDKYLSMQEILFDKEVKPTPVAKELIDKLNEQSKIKTDK
jgi:SH3 domain-containing YSC84-like protein 1